MSVQDPDHVLLEQARVQARRLLGEVGHDVDALRDAASDAAYQEGAALCEDVARATNELLTQLDAELAPPQVNENPAR